MSCEGETRLSAGELSGEPDAKIWNYSFENDFVVVTCNARDFIRLLNVEVHPGLIVLREGGLTLARQRCVRSSWW
jgi:predicted nuclease of predicted toxin-antitoxin system